MIGLRRLRRYQNLREIRAGRTPDYHFYHADEAATYRDPRGREVLVVGANTGEECRLFVQFGAAAVHGIDVVDELGTGYRHKRVTYTRASVEDLPFEDDRFDLVYASATMEHVRGLEAGFAEMARVTAPDGVVYSQASPLWNSPFGHHKGDLFAEDPWIHLRMSEDEILAHCAARGIEEPARGIEAHVRYMLDPAYFGMRAAADYVRICAALPRLEILANDIAEVDPALLTDALAAELEVKGISRSEALGQTHTFIARKLAA